MKKNHSRIDLIILNAFFISIYFWGIISIQVSFYSGLNESLLGYLKYALILFSILFFVVRAGGFKLNSVLFVMLIYISYLTLHAFPIFSQKTLFDSVKFEILPVIFGLSFFNYMLYYPSLHNSVFKIMFGLGLIVLVFSCIEYIDRSIIEIIYRRAINDIPHSTWFSAPRYISVAENPIMLGFHLSFLICLIAFFRFKGLNAAMYVSLIATSLFFSALTLSRTSLITSALMAFLVYMAKSKPLGKVIFASIIFVVSASYAENIYLNAPLVIKRFSGLLSLSEYTGNIRVVNWANALEHSSVINLIWGFGLGASSPSLDDMIQYDTFIVENNFVTKIVNFGLFGLIIYLTILLVFMVFLGKLKRLDRNLYISSASFLITYLLFSLGNDTDRNMPFNYIFWTILSLVCASVISKREEK